MKVLVIDAIAREGVDFLASRGFQVDQIPSAVPAAELFARIGDYEAIVTRSSTAVTAEFLGHARRLKILGRAGVGVDNIDVDACSRKGVVVVNAPRQRGLGRRAHRGDAAGAGAEDPAGQ